jgi:hypothetical protein
MSTHAALIDAISHTFEERKLGNTGTVTYWRINNGVSFMDSMYDIDKYLRKDWVTISLAGASAEQQEFDPISCWYILIFSSACLRISIQTLRDAGL